MAEYTVRVHHATEPDPHYWAEVSELPGCFATGFTLDELRESLTEAIALYLDKPLPT
jgi:predicted RNase H-like HicB family nuclease